MKKKKYTKEFRQQAIQLADSLGSTIEAAKQLGISDGSIYKWRIQQLVDGEAPTIVSGNEVEELKRLRRENSDLKKINHILKSAAAFFSQDHLK